MKIAATRSSLRTVCRSRTAFDHVAGAVRDRNQRQFHGHREGAFDDRAIAIVERCRADPDQDLAGPGVRQVGRSLSLRLSIPLNRRFPYSFIVCPVAISYHR